MTSATQKKYAVHDVLRRFNAVTTEGRFPVHSVPFHGHRTRGEISKLNSETDAFILSFPSRLHPAVFESTQGRNKHGTPNPRSCPLTL